MHGLHKSTSTGMGPRERDKMMVYNASANLAWIMTAVIEAVKAYMHTYEQYGTNVRREKRPRVLKKENRIQSGRKRRHMYKFNKQIPESRACNSMIQTIGVVATAELARLAFMAEPRRSAPMVTNGTQVSVHQSITKRGCDILIGRKYVGNETLKGTRIKENPKLAP